MTNAAGRLGESIREGSIRELLSPDLVEKQGELGECFPRPYKTTIDGGSDWVSQMKGCLRYLL